MITVDVLLEWMTHLGTGQWGLFRDAVPKLSVRDGLETEATARELRITLSDLGHVDFFEGGSRCWRVLKPALVGLQAQNCFVLAGGRSRVLIDGLESLGGQHGASVSTRECSAGLSQVFVRGDQAAISEMAMRLGIAFIPRVAAYLAASVPDLRRTLTEAPIRLEPINWDVRSWSFEERTWIPGKFPRTALEYSNRHDVHMYLVDCGHGQLREVGKRESIYCAALQKGVRVARYSFQERCLRVPRWAPLPEFHSRASCMASGRRAVVLDSELQFEEVEAQVAGLLMAGLGQGVPIAEDAP